MVYLMIMDMQHGKDRIALDMWEDWLQNDDSATMNQDDKSPTILPFLDNFKYYYSFP